MSKPCAHHWVIEPPDGQDLLRGECKRCGEVREFKADPIGSLTPNEYGSALTTGRARDRAIGYPPGYWLDYP